MDKSDSPAMSVVLVTPNDYSALGKVVRHLGAQTVRHSLELIIVAPSAANLRANESELRDFCQHQIVEVGPIQATGAAMAEGFRRASAPIVAYVEEHSYPEPGWAEAVIQAHTQPWVAVGWGLANANPATLTSWAHFFCDFAPWIEPSKSAEVFRLPAHHSSYKRDVILEFGSSLPRLLETPLIMDSDLRARGHTFYLESAAKAYHVNCSSFRSFLRAEYDGGRLFGAARANYHHWTLLRKLLYIGAAPLIPPVRLRRIWADIRRTGRQRQLLPKVIPILVSGLIAHTLGETISCLVGPGDAARQRVSIELTRHRHVTKKEKIREETAPTTPGPM